MSVQSIIRFTVKPGREADFESAFEASGMLSRPRAIEGFLGAQLLRSHDAPREYYVIGNWSSAEAYALWQEASLAGADTTSRAALIDTLDNPRPGRLFHTVSSAPGA